MEYVPLKKLYFQNKAQWEQTYANRFASADTVHLEIPIHDSPAFFLQTPEILRIVIWIQRLDKQIVQLCQMLPKVAVEQFSRRCLIDEIVLTNSIEGVSSTRREIAQVLEELGRKDRQKRFHGLVQKYSMLAKQQSIPLSTGHDVRAIYDELVLQEVAQADLQNCPDGALFRKGPVFVLNAAGKEIHRGLFPEAQIIAAMDSALSFLQREDVDILIRIAGFHYLLGYIHPFYDGNGRLSRFISSYLLSQELSPLIGYRLSYTIRENIGHYYSAFKDGNDFRNRGDLTPFIFSFLSLVAQAMEQLFQALQKRRTELSRYEIIVSRELPTGKEQDLLFILVQASLFADRGISTRELLAMLEISRATLQTRLQALGDLVSCQRAGKEKYYQADLRELEKLESTSVIDRP